MPSTPTSTNPSTAPVAIGSAAIRSPGTSRGIAGGVRDEAPPVDAHRRNVLFGRHDHRAEDEREVARLAPPSLGAVMSSSA